MTNPVLQAIADRRSIRAYRQEQIEEEQLQAILRAAEQAPSATNAQAWHFTVVQDAALLKRINEAFRKEAIEEMGPENRARFEDPAYSVFYHAPTVIFLSCPSLEEKRYAQTDIGIAVENMALAAHSMGLGSVILGMPRLAFEGEEADALCGLLKFPQGYAYCLAIAVGIPAMTKEAHPIHPDRISYVR